MKNCKKMMGIIICILCTIILIGCGRNSNGNQSVFKPEVKETEDFISLFADDYGNKSWCTFGADGSYMKIDSNPMNYDNSVLVQDDDALTESLECLGEISNINAKLGFPLSLQEKMIHTTALQGVQSESNELYNVTWSYHPDNGIEIIYEYNGK